MKFYILTMCIFLFIVAGCDKSEPVKVEPTCPFSENMIDPKCPYLPCTGGFWAQDNCQVQVYRYCRVPREPNPCDEWRIKNQTFEVL